MGHDQLCQSVSSMNLAMVQTYGDQAYNLNKHVAWMPATSLWGGKAACRFSG